MRAGEYAGWGGVGRERERERGGERESDSVCV